MRTLDEQQEVFLDHVAQISKDLELVSASVRLWRKIVTQKTAASGYVQTGRHRVTLYQDGTYMLSAIVLRQTQPNFTEDDRWLKMLPVTDLDDDFSVGLTD